MLFGVVLTYYVPHAKTPNSKTSRCARRIYLSGPVFLSVSFFNVFAPSRRPNDKNKTYQFLRYVFGFIKNTLCVSMSFGEAILLLVVKTDGFSKWRPYADQIANLSRKMKGFVIFCCLNIDTMS